MHFITAHEQIQLNRACNMFIFVVFGSNYAGNSLYLKRPLFFSLTANPFFYMGTNAAYHGLLSSENTAFSFSPPNAHIEIGTVFLYKY
jgi:hypothetical protein